MHMASTSQKNFRMSADAVQLLRQIARDKGMTETEIVELCVAKYAAEVGADIERAKALLLNHVAKGIASRKPRR